MMCQLRVPLPILHEIPLAEIRSEADSLIDVCEKSAASWRQKLMCLQGKATPFHHVCFRAGMCRLKEWTDRISTISSRSIRLAVW